MRGHKLARETLSNTFCPKPEVNRQLITECRTYLFPCIFINPNISTCVTKNPGQPT